MIFEKTAPLILIFLLGFLLKKKGIVTEKDSGILSKLLVYVVVPIIIINSFSNIIFEPSLIYIPLSALIVVFSFLISGYILAKLLKLENKTRGAFMVAFPTLEGGTIGYAFMLSAFGELGLSRIVLFDAVNAFFLFTVVYFVSCRLGKGGTSLKQAVEKILKTPLVWAIFTGIFLNLIGFKNGFFTNFSDIVGGSTIFLIMILLGLEFKPSFSSLKLPVITIMLKTGFGLALGLILSYVFGLDGIERAAVVIGSSLPPSIITLIFAKENDLDTEYAANLISVSLPFAVIFLTILVSFL